MSIHDVPRWRWADALEEFSRGHRGWLASVVRWVLVRCCCPIPAASAGIRNRPQTGSVRVGFQGGPTVLVEAPRTLGVDRRDDGAERSLEIDTAGAESVRLVFRETALPDALDGIAPAELVEPVG